MTGLRGPLSLLLLACLSSADSKPESAVAAGVLYTAFTRGLGPAVSLLQPGRRAAGRP